MLLWRFVPWLTPNYKSNISRLYGMYIHSIKMLPIGTPNVQLYERQLAASLSSLHLRPTWSSTSSARKRSGHCEETGRYRKAGRPFTKPCHATPCALETQTHAFVQQIQGSLRNTRCSTPKVNLIDGEKKLNCVQSFIPRISVKTTLVNWILFFIFQGESIVNQKNTKSI